MKKDFFFFEKTMPDTRTGCSCGGWAGAVMWRAGAVGGPVYTTASVTYAWAGALMKKPLAKCRKRRKRKGGTDRPINRPTDRQTDRHSDL